MWWPRTCLIWPRNSARDAAQVPEPNQGTSRTPRVRSVKYILIVTGEQNRDAFHRNDLENELDYSRLYPIRAGNRIY
jgi:hypothetical protein